MKKLLSLLSMLTISGSAMPTIIAANPYQKGDNKLNIIKRGINSQKLNNLIDIKNNLSEKVKDMGEKVIEECQLMILLERDLTLKLQELGNYLKEDLSKNIKNITINKNNIKQSIQNLGQNVKTFGIKMKAVGELVKQITNGLIKSLINVEDLGNGSISQGEILEKLGEIIYLYQNENLTTDSVNISKINENINIIGQNINTIGIKLTIDEKLKYYPDILLGLKDYRMIVKPWLTNELNGYVLGNKLKKIGDKVINIQKYNNQISNQNIEDLGQNIEDLGEEIKNVSLIIEQGYKSTKAFGFSLIELGKFIKSSV
ncbi:hypothetical protein [Spiroplasma endosymbiont of Polydrusus pterygomalis]|uniref:hypothetical protein n=1 Tax=Spiroplasma endosymbiont of Polydrusus pterygomalis TaxID=3139327 RepID=UPI003CCAE70B